MAYKTIEEIYPMTLVCDRYGGTYSGGIYTAWMCDPWDVPVEIEESDGPCDLFWESYTGPVGKGATPLQAMEDLRIKINEFNEETHMKYGLSYKSKTNETPTNN